MEDYCTVHSYDVFDGAMVHAFKQNSYGKAPVKPLSEAEISKVGMAFRQLTLNHTYRSALTKLTKNEVINNIMLMVPGLNEDPVAITLLFHSELLVKFVDQEVVKRIAESHPALAAGALQMAAIVHDALQAFSENHLESDYARNMQNIVSDEDVEDIDDSSPASEASSQPVTRNLSFGAITTAQLASAIASVRGSVTTQQPQPSTSGASTSTGITENALGNALAALQNQQTPSESELSTQLQIMREMGLANEAINRAALRVSNGLESAIELVLSGFGNSDNRSNS